MTARVSKCLVASVFSVLVAGCHSGSGPGDRVGGEFIVLQTTPGDAGLAFLNDSIYVDLSQTLDIQSADFDSVTFAVFDLNGLQLSEPVEGTFRLGRSDSDDEVGRRLEFMPSFPRTNTFADGGFKPGRRYIVQLVKGDHRTAVGLVDTRGKGLEVAYSFDFSTVDGTTPGQLFRDTKVGGPRRIGFDVAPLDPKTGEADLNELGQIGTEIRLRFDQPLNPHSDNLPLSVDLDPSNRKLSARGRIYLEYDDPVTGATWIPSAGDLERNSLDGAEVVVRPIGILPNNAEIRVIVEANVEDLAGESNANDPAYERIFGTFRTSSGYQLRFDALAESFLDVGLVDFAAPFVEPVAEVLPGGIRAGFAFESGRSTIDYAPTTSEVILDTNFTQIQPSNGGLINVSGGVFRFRNVRIPNGAVVRGVGANPMVWLVTGDFIVEGKLTVDGGDGPRVNSINSANIPAAGGVGNCHGGSGGLGSPQSSRRSSRGATGFGPGQEPGGGGEGGRINCANAGCGIGSGGGGGTFATQGDPNYKVKATAEFVQPRGIGGYGCTGRTSKALPGGDAGPLAFTDKRPGNDFWGSAVDLHRNVRFSGELSSPHGGQGGGGGGDNALNCAPNDPNFAFDNIGGGGGGGGGVLVIKALGDIIIKETGRISADGGDGGGGAFAGGNNRCGGGGAGSGGMVVLIAGGTIDIAVRGETYANNDYEFAISADGGISRKYSIWRSTKVITSKYVPKPHLETAASLNTSPTGGFGGMGIVQLMAPSGPNLSGDDGTNTILDDNIIVRRGQSVLRGADKQRFLGWRGLPDENGVWVDDSGTPVNLGDDEGDVRPSPILLPSPIGSRSRIRSRWIDLGHLSRRMTSPGGDGLPRGVEKQGSLVIGRTFGPLPEFAGVIAGNDTRPLAGYVKLRNDGLGGVEFDYPRIVAGLPVASIESDVPFRGQRVMVVKLASVATALEAAHDRYSHYTAALREGSGLLGEYRILGHTGDVLYLSAASGALAPVSTSSGRAIELTVVAKFFSIYTADEEGLPQTFDGGGGRRLPIASVRIRFAFHQDPADPTAKRFPVEPTKFFSDWSNAAALDQLRVGAYRFLQYDILFDTRYEEDVNFRNPTTLSPDSPRPEIRSLVLPYRY